MTEQETGMTIFIIIEDNNIDEINRILSAKPVMKWIRMNENREIIIE